MQKKKSTFFEDLLLVKKCKIVYNIVVLLLCFTLVTCDILIDQSF